MHADGLKVQSAAQQLAVSTEVLPAVLHSGGGALRVVNITISPPCGLMFSPLTHRPGLSPNMRIAIGVGIGMFAFFVMMVDEYVDTFNPATETDGAAAANAARQLGIRVVDSDRK